MKMFAGTLLAAMLAMGSAHAEVVAFNFTAKVDESNANNGKGPGLDIAVGDVVHGRFSFDVSTPLSTLVEWTPEFHGRLYESPQHPVFAAITVERTGQTSVIDHSFTSSISVLDAPVSWGGDSLTFQTSIQTPDWSQSRWLEFNFGDRSGTALDSKSIPSSFALSAFEYASFSFGWSDRTTDSPVSSGGNGTITSMTRVVTSPVPEPTTYAMFAVGLLALGAMTRRKAASQP